jgi:integrase/recombinase XerD
MHLLQAGVDITTTTAWLGHSQLNTTHGYVEINLRMKQKALAAITSLPELAGGSFPEDDVLTARSSRPAIAQAHGYAGSCLR